MTPLESFSSVVHNVAYTAMPFIAILVDLGLLCASVWADQMNFVHIHICIMAVIPEGIS